MPCLRTPCGARLVVMDNLYMYGPPEGPMTEETPHRATGPKGRLRAQLAQLLLDAHRSGRLPVAIGRASDFFGRTRNNSVSLLVFETVVRKGKASWLGSLDAPRTSSYLPDVAWGLTTLAEHPDEAFGQAWHLAAAEPLTGRQFIQMVFEVAGKPLRFTRHAPDAPPGRTLFADHPGGSGAVLPVRPAVRDGHDQVREGVRAAGDAVPRRDSRHAGVVPRITPARAALIAGRDP
ncbi:NAD-dependent epimerase/dehydratase family protein [Carboxydochorda subterranea]|uniref:NAD-dependent epimerase/dehydratase family protein n=1 Tax=Carboxydichorda subterranea TaxID=3109565 RepID=A0ABZ1C170_9FIRM|nr:NAD-dependent epimerase/dehydratase family protein [Limnochorda sp. L945t]WRP18694.1 NAD-dependent epimerase/dehydratase family protein [Limnochorda sp. L945t]